MTIDLARLVGFRNPTFSKKSGFLAKLGVTFHIRRSAKYSIDSQRRVKIEPTQLSTYKPIYVT
jgi:hypothetical protein